MRKMSHLALLLVLFVLVLSACTQPVPLAPAAAEPAAADETAGASAESAPAGEAQRGGVWSLTLGSDPTNLNPILYSGTNSSDVGLMLWTALIGQDPVTGELTPEGSMSKSWDVSDDGLTYTFHLRDDAVWSDGDPIDANDFVFTYNAIKAEGIESPRTYVWDGIKSIEAPDPYTVVIQYDELLCSALWNLGSGWLPSHLFAADFSDVMSSPENEAPTVSAGPFNFQSWARDDNVVLVRNEKYVDGAPNMDGMIYRVVPDAGARLAQLQSGEVDVSDVQPSQITAVEGNPNITTYQWNDDGYTYIGLNLANPANPQPGMDENGNLVVQDPHPILGDVRVRQAIAHALDYDSIIQNIFFGKGYRMAANVFPSIEWAYNPDVAPYDFDVEKAKALLEEAGWVDSNGDGVREKDGAPLALRLITNSSNTARMDLGAYVQDQLNSIGFNIDFQGIEFGTLLEQMDAQTTDMFILGWTGLGSDPDDSAIFGADQDIPGSGFNAVSLVNAKLEELFKQGKSMPGCKNEDRGPVYKEIQQIMHDELPYIWVTGRVPVVGYNSRWAGIDPQPWSATSTAPIYWNVQDWSIKAAE